jgi:hypothetical protein
MEKTMNDITEKYNRYHRARAEANAHNKGVVFDALTAAGITSVTVSFDGAGDSGQIDDVHCEGSEADILQIHITIRSNDWGCEPIDESTTLYSGIESLCYGYLEQEHGGWEINDGAFGDFTLDVANRTIHLEFNGRFSDCNTSEHSF